MHSMRSSWHQNNPLSAALTHPQNQEPLKTETMKTKILSEEEANILIDADLDAYLEYEHVARIAEATERTIGEIKAEIAAAPSPFAPEPQTLNPEPINYDKKRLDK